ncbi:hypothetical protein E5676_scaffold349G00670 [Cucumis melo var. makuwa]|uniref:Uncharacterized protein n=1 Tax=Cucumis melo var. makuwa TaxID=1194695 RepID=A0A5D3E3S1_CUCMM|nr:hypothetical protein E6C27_scaffold56G001500 [Cucumis melo var. makuwa]TYK30449.1 hypothetical protein E5676_scaffold349G00670 [Cucumis melo var. makuwa]
MARTRAQSWSWLWCGVSNSMEGTSNTGYGTRDKSHIKYFTYNKMEYYATECCGKDRDNETHLTYATNCCVLKGNTHWT